MKRLIFGLLVSAFALVCVAQPQPLPYRTVTLVSPFPPGGSTDAIARIMAQRMGVALGQTVIVENSGGAGGSIGGRAGAAAAAPRCPLPHPPAVRDRAHRDRPH